MAEWAALSGLWQGRAAHGTVDGYCRCNQCKEDFTIRSCTIFELQLAKEIGITQKSAWFVLHRLREVCGGPGLKKLAGIIKIDETFVGGKER